MKKLLFVIGFFILSVSHCHGQLIYQDGRLAFNQPISNQYNTLWAGLSHKWGVALNSVHLTFSNDALLFGAWTMTNRIVFYNVDAKKYNDLQCRNIYQTSDMRLKTNVTPLVNRGKDNILLSRSNYSMTEAVLNLQPVSYQWIDSTSNRSAENGVEYGFIAQDMMNVFPEVVSETPEGDLSINYIALIPILTATIQELTERVEFLENKLERLENTSVK